jgi:CheY-like chemotaxis protein
LKVLLVDDVDFFREVMRDYLKRTPVQIIMAQSGSEAIEMASRELPDLAYMDVNMPGMNGIEACRKLKSDARLKKIPVLLIFTPLRDASIEEVKASGCDGYLVKPFGRKEFLNLGHRHLFHIERRERRVPCQMTVDFTIAGRSFQAIGADISSHGLYIEFRDELPPDKQIRFNFILPTVSAHRITGTGRIAWANQGFPRSNLSLAQGFGVEIQAMDKESAAVIRSYLDLS